ncbi:Gis3 protein [Maudiozyma humilis]|uniref:Gis3 protein n=1 Tax=Maudiozyma humilis TaxID=51915 RepID=A0AAV5RX68_MAUHU|nr:Gis3 protein [Kazachstania humilis]
MFLSSLAMLNTAALEEKLALPLKDVHQKGKNGKSSDDPGMGYPGSLVAALGYKRSNTDAPVVNTASVMRSERPGSLIRPKRRSVSGPVTPSMSAVISQIRQMSQGRAVPSEIPSSQNRIRRSLSDTYKVKEGAFPRKRDMRRSSGTSAEMQRPRHHPLEGPGEATAASQQRNVNEPPIVRYNMDDLELQDSLSEKDIVQAIGPSYVRPRSVPASERRRKQSGNKTAQVSKKRADLELEVWPDSNGTNDNSSSGTTANILPDNKRLRQRSMNPNFLKLLALERQSIDKNVLPEVYIDPQTFESLSLHPDTQVVDSLDFNDEVRLAIKTKLKLRNELGRGELRSDIYGDAAPWNQKFIPHHARDAEFVDSSLVRLNSTVKPWCSDTTQMSESQRMLKPCGKLPDGSQYVVKGWCDSRFVQ